MVTRSKEVTEKALTKNYIHPGNIHIKKYGCAPKSFTSQIFSVRTPKKKKIVEISSQKESDEKKI